MKHDWSGGTGGDHECVKCGAWASGLKPVSSLPVEGCSEERILYSKCSPMKMHALEPGEARIEWQINLARHYPDGQCLVWREKFSYGPEPRERFDVRFHDTKDEAMKDYDSRVFPTT